MYRSVSLLLIYFFSYLICYGQERMTVSGIVVDSLTFETLPDVHIKLKNSGKGTATDKNGYFEISLPAFDTLVFTSVGHITLIYPVFSDEEDVVIRLKEEVTMLMPVTVRSKPVTSPLIQEKRPYPTRSSPPHRLASSSGISLSYFSREQREKRKLQALREENEKVRHYYELINEEEFIKEAVRIYFASENEYHQALLAFNQNRLETIHHKSREEVAQILNAYFCSVSPLCR